MTPRFDCILYMYIVILYIIYWSRSPVNIYIDLFNIQTLRVKGIADRRQIYIADCL